MSFLFNSGWFSGCSRSFSGVWTSGRWGQSAHFRRSTHLLDRVEWEPKRKWFLWMIKNRSNSWVEYEKTLKETLSILAGRFEWSCHLFNIGNCAKNPHVEDFEKIPQSLDGIFSLFIPKVLRITHSNCRTIQHHPTIHGQDWQETLALVQRCKFHGVPWQFFFWQVEVQRTNYLPSLKVTAKAPENRPKPKRKGLSSIHHFVFGSVMPMLITRKNPGGRGI